MLGRMNAAVAMDTLERAVTQVTFFLDIVPLSASDISALFTDPCGVSKQSVQPSFGVLTARVNVTVTPTASVMT